MSLGDKLQQYGVLIVGLMLGGGFAFGGIASYSSMISGGGTSQQQEFNATLPEKSFVTGSYDLTRREKAVLAIRNDVVFASVFYNTSRERQRFEGYGSFVERFSGRVYMEVLNRSSTEYTTLGLSGAEAAVIGRRTRGRVMPVQEASRKQLEDAVCRSVADLGAELVAVC